MESLAGQVSTAPSKADVAAEGPTTSYDPETETDHLIREHITLDPVTGEAVFRAMNYPVWAVVLNLRATDYDWQEVRRTFPELPLAALRAAKRFWQRHPEDVLVHFA